MTAEPKIELAEVFALADLTRVGDLLVDSETGEVIEWPASVPSEGRIEWLQAQHRDAQEQEDRWGMAKGNYSRALDAYLTKLGARQYVGGGHKSWAVSEGTRRAAPAERLRELVSLEALIPSAAHDLMWTLAKELDVKAIEAAVKDGTLPRPVGEHLIVKTTSAGYVRTEPLTRAAPEITKEHSNDR